MFKNFGRRTKKKKKQNQEKRMQIIRSRYIHKHKIIHLNEKIQKDIVVILSPQLTIVYFKFTCAFYLWNFESNSIHKQNQFNQISYTLHQFIICEVICLKFTNTIQYRIKIQGSERKREKIYIMITRMRDIEKYIIISSRGSALCLEYRYISL